MTAVDTAALTALLNAEFRRLAIACFALLLLPLE
jgi:hypothetical protein